MRTGDLERAFKEATYSDNMDRLNTGLSNITFTDNIKGEVVTIDNISISSGSEIIISHRLKGVPIGKIILRQVGNGFITDGPVWDEKKISIINNGPADITYLRMFIVRE